MAKLTLSYTDETYAVCRLPADAAIPSWVNTNAAFISITRTADELSIVLPSAHIQEDDSVTVEKDWRAFKVEGPLDFSLNGILLSIAQPLADAKISIFAISTFDTDYILVKAEQFDQAVKTLEGEFNVISN